MARPREFDVDVALDRAMHAFWRDGYHASSLSSLTRAMCIGKSSVYGAFGSKRALFLAALDRYIARGLRAHAEVVADQRCRPKDALRRWLKRMAAEAKHIEPASGYLDATMLAVLLPKDATVDGRIRRAIAQIEATYAAAIRRGQDVGDFDRRLDAKAAAHHLLVCAYGLTSLSRITQLRSIDGSISLALAPLLPK